MNNYDHREIEKKWQNRWAEEGLYKTPDTVAGKENYYTLVEFPYPSGDLHVGHWSAFAVPDIFARMKRMQGYNVLYPIGFDAFGLPAENAAIKNGADPAEWTNKNIDRMRNQLKLMGNMFDWDREVAACDPSFYKWTQWLFLKLFEKGLAYRKKAFVNWCPKDQTVLANEQVIGGKCERCDTPVEQKDLEQWFLKITEYADRLIDDLENLEWPNAIKEAQRNWIGRSEGAEINFDLTNGKKITVFTTRPDTLFGATYLVLAPEHSLLNELIIENKNDVLAYQKKAAAKSDLERQENKEKTGVELLGIKAINPGTKKEIPVFIADYVLSHYGTGAIMAVPAHDERDFAFAKKFNLEVKRVIEPTFVARDGDAALRDGEIIKREAVCVILRNPKNGTYLCNEWKGIEMKGLLTGGVDDGEDIVKAAEREILEETGYKNVKLAHDPKLVVNTFFYHRQKGVNRHARFHYLVFDLIDDQREPIDESEVLKHEFVWKTRAELQNYFTVYEGYFILDFLDNPEYIYTGAGTLGNSEEFDGLESKNAKRKITESVGGKMTKTYRQRDWLISRQRYWGTPIPIVYDPEGRAHKVPDEYLPWTLPTDVDFTPTGKAPLATSKELVERTENIFGAGWRPEVDTMDTFMDSSWYFLRYLDPQNNNEFVSQEKQKAWMPVTRYSGGAEHTTMHILYSRFFYKALFDLGLVTEHEPYKVRMNRGLILAEDGRKMSKRWGNVINPDEQVENVGADAVKMYLAFIGPYNEAGSYPWSTNGLIGVRRFLERVWYLKEKVIETEVSTDLETLLHQTIQKVGNDVESMKMNTSVSALMILTNELHKLSEVPHKAYMILLTLLAPFAPHLSEELWHSLGKTTSIHLEPWPQFDPKKLVADTVKIAVQIGGKVRGVLELRRGVSEEEVREAIKNDPRLSKYLDFEPKKTIFVLDRVINLIP